MHWVSSASPGLVERWAGRGDSECQDVGKFVGRMPGQDLRAGPLGN